jgi:hypothetical protein
MAAHTNQPSETIASEQLTAWWVSRQTHTRTISTVVRNRLPSDLPKEVDQIITQAK